MNQKKILSGVIFFLATLFVVSLARAGEKKDQINAFLDKGIRFETADQNYSMTLSPRIQVRYAYSNREGPANDAQSVILRRVYFSIFGSVFVKDLTYYLRLNLNPGSTTAVVSNVLEYSWLDYRFSDTLHVQTGLLKLPFNRQEMTSSGKQQFVDRSLANERYNLDRSLAFVVHGEPFEKIMEYYLSVSNGRATQARLNENQEMAYTARVAFNPLGEYGEGGGDIKNSESFAMTLGLAGSLHKEETAVSPAQDRVLTGTVDLGLKYQGLSFETAGFYRNTTRGGGASAINDFGYYAQAGYFFIPKKFEFAVRASGLFDDLGNKGGGVYFENGSLTGLGGVNDGVDEAGDSANEHEFSAVLNYHFKPHKIKWQTQYTLMLDGQTGTSSLTNHILMSQIQVEI
ncbi:MAG: hypothetical protein HQM16_12795 [Deltaproteobacteria bacterium]|nr:hypothetical protein [Deltaproteobacteria bacterium]